MPTVPSLPPELLQQSAQGSGGAMPTNPLNYLMAAADLHQSGDLSTPVPTGSPLQTGKPIAKGKGRGRSKLQVVK
jgi:hypothetical protein